ncbi:hypothetical protein [Mangrovibacter yixingensis]|uniref:hypothetical protein n=1 Tax=Mangrovibacter yixingensis TaxID=1529639 RepID=UPI001CFB1FC8|nr:hypothetical protein [Mangrovibacter yixingensis]
MINIPAVLPPLTLLLVWCFSLAMGIAHLAKGLRTYLNLFAIASVTVMGIPVH